MWTLQSLAAQLHPPGRRGAPAIINIDVDGERFHLVLGDGVAARRDAHSAPTNSVSLDHDALESLRAGAATMDELIEADRAVMHGNRRAITRALQSATR